MEISPHHNVVRNVGASKILENGRVDGSAFKVRPVDTDGLTVNLLDFFAGISLDAQIGEVRKCFAAKGRKIGPSSKFAELNVGVTSSHVHTHESRVIEFIHCEEENDGSHSGIMGYNPEDDIIADLIAQTVQHLHPGVA